MLNRRAAAQKDLCESLHFVTAGLFLDPGENPDQDADKALNRCLMNIADGDMTRYCFKTLTESLDEWSKEGLVAKQHDLAGGAESAKERGR